MANDAGKILGMIKDQEIASTVSIGIAVCPTDASRPTDVLRDADIAMYHAKRAGRRAFAVFDEAMNSTTTSSSQLWIKAKIAPDIKMATPTTKTTPQNPT